ncbi:hypothetical protein MGYG_08506 [Nannizzia gypsea CBS 118893]|uniref:Uncharacterized protein n=1 Tax=Arthroderma gypseum (strain ATCC MYA-4604 / CBS 118893) TaxID=535722 RepID=E4V5W6_ARTGP|nr:hypothetical protein MGYG_08506 [Nannizzia gypsea CBS 118893]EFR05491.1 hypothetical protein MGYG_08506 [Nannizzia gypsea CBS 118893]
MAPAADIVVDETKRLVGNMEGLDLLETLESMQRRLDALEQSAKLSEEKHIRAMMTLRRPIYKSPNSISRYRRNALVYGGSVLVDLDIVQFITDDASEFGVWSSGFEDIYGMPYSYGKLISHGSKMVALADARADLELLEAFEAYRQTYLPKCDAIIRLWKAAIDDGQDPEGIFRSPAAMDLYNRIMHSFNSVLSY